MVQPLYLTVVLLAAVVGAAVAFAAWVHGDRPGSRPLTLFVVTASFWAVAEGLAVASAGIGAIRFWTQVGLTISAVVPIAWLVTVLEYTGTDEWLSRRRLAALLVWPAAFVFLVWTAEGHDLVWTDSSTAFLGEFSVFVMDFGLAFWAQQVYAYLLVAGGAALLVRTILRTNRLYRVQSTALLVAIAVPMVGNALYVFSVLPPGVDPTGVGYVVTGVVLAVAMFRAQLLRVAPAVRDLGREAVLADLDDAVFILDEAERVVDANEAAESLLGATDEAYLGQPLSACLPDLAGALDGGESPLRLDGGGEARYYDVQVSRLARGYGAVTGLLVSLRDVTDQRRREQRLDVLNRVLRHNIRNELNIVRGHVELARSAVDDGAAERLDAAVETVDDIVERSNKVGQLSRLSETTDGPIDLGERLGSDLDAVADEYPGADITVALPDSLPVAAGPSVTVAFEELLVNAVEHNDADRPQAEVELDESASDTESVVVTVADDGPGIDAQEYRAVEAGRETPLSHASGLGLWLANWVVERYGGSLSFENTDDGCVVGVSLPRAEGGATSGENQSGALADAATADATERIGGGAPTGE
ncbi:MULTISPECIES: histidine kinase N-terminal 7TM domain-containing protein [Salinibaculum]|uniref:histidine kinase N-terminal 7TM domain-containing protein n=1 Tax=Salinibaculum TaxID=2732368 RepID=UPI0030D5A291